MKGKTVKLTLKHSSYTCETLELEGIVTNNATKEHGLMLKKVFEVSVDREKMKDCFVPWSQVDGAVILK